MFKHWKFWILLFALVPASRSEAQIAWNKIVVPDTIAGFAIGADGSLYVNTGWFRSTHDLYFSSDRGVSWTKVYSGSIRSFACDSNGAVIIANDAGAVYSTNHGVTWTTFSTFSSGFSGRGGIECTREAIYCIPGYDNALYRKIGYDSTWQSIAIPSGEIDDLTGPYCGTSDRIVVGLNSESGWELLDSLKTERDSLCKMQGPFADNSPPRLITFGKDGYLYMSYMSYYGFMRLPFGSRSWDCYDPSDTSWGSRSHHFPYSSVSPTMLISADTGGTWVSSDHASSWDRMGSAPPMSWLWQIAFDAIGHGYAHTDSGLFETDFFASVKNTSETELSLALSPNPCGSSLTIITSNVRNVQIMDALGRRRMLEHFSNPQNDPEVKVEMLPAGAYYALVEANGSRKVIPFIKN